jgi:hypothetical protein
MTKILHEELKQELREAILKQLEIYFEDCNKLPYCGEVEDQEKCIEERKKLARKLKLNERNKLIHTFINDYGHL